MQLTVLGCRSGMPAAGQPSSGYLVDAGSTVLLDCGPGITTALTALADPEDLDAVVISHLHSDHCYDLLPLGKALLQARARRVGGDPMEALRHLDRERPGVPLYVPEGGRALLDRLAALFAIPTFPLLDKAFEIAFAVHEYPPGEVVELPGCRMSLHPLRHAAPNCGVRVDTGAASLAYTGDTGLCDGFAPLASGADLLLAEATLDATDTGAHGHLSAADAGSIAAANGVGELVLTHFASADPGHLEARRAAAAEVFDGPIALAQPGTRHPVVAQRTERIR